MTMLKPRLLLIDNDDALLEALSIRLSNEGYECITANSGSQGLSLFNETDYVAVITDLNMPGGDGIAVCESIRASSDVPLIIMTGFESSYADPLSELSNIYLMHKPFDISALLDELDIAIEMTIVDYPT
jgi:DNA-binding response OmpR family regulator